MELTSMRTQFLWITVALAAAFLAATKAEAQPARRPNILLIYTDDQSYKTVGCYPEALPGVKTPHIDQLAARGIRFHGAYLGAWCMPSRASLLTGRLPHGVESMRMAQPYPSSTYDPAQCPFWPRIFREHGYVTAQIGKWHTGVDAGTGRDWDWQIVWNRPKHPDNAGNYYDDQILSFNGEEQRQDGYSTDNYTRWACEFIRGEHREKEKPWFLWLCYGGVHGPTTPAERHKGQHKNDEIVVPKDIFPPRPGKPEYLELTQAWARGESGHPVAGKSGETFGDESGMTRKTFADFVHQVNDCAQSLDEGVGQVMAALQESGQLDNTLVVFTADQGFGMGEHGFRTKLAPYDATFRSPLIVSWPGKTVKGKACSACATAGDLVATFFAAAGLQLPWDVHGRDLTPLLKEPAATWPHPVLYEFTGDQYGSNVTRVVTETPEKAVYHDVPWYIAMRHERWKYIRYLTPGETEELYDLEADPEELVNLADRAEHRTALASLRQTAEEELRRTKAPFAGKLAPTRQTAAAALPTPTITPPFRTVDLDVGQSAEVTLDDGNKVVVRLLDLKEQRDSLRSAVRRAEVQVEVAGQSVTLVSGTYRLPTTVGRIQIDCPITRGYLDRSTKTTGGLGPWGLERAARLRVWPAGSTLVNPGTFMYPARQRWFASSTQMANEPTYVDGGEKPGSGNIYYHYGLDIGGAEGHVDVVAATDGLVVSLGTEALPGYQDTPVSPRYDVVYLLDDRGWFYRYSHLHTISPQLALGKRVRMGDAIGILGKEGGSGGWSHLHFDISGRQPSGQWGIIEGYAFLWEAYLREHKPQLIAVARPHHFVNIGEKLTLDGSRSWSAAGKLKSYEWTFTDGTTAKGATVERAYDKPGYYSEVLKVTDAGGNTDYDFAIVNVADKARPEQRSPTIHATYAPTMGIQPGQNVKFLVRTFGTTDGEETWDFGDGSEPVVVHSDGNVVKLAKDGYAMTSHAFAKPGIYLVQVQRSSKQGFTATAHLKVLVGQR